MAWLGLALSIILLIATSALLAQRLSPRAPDRFWIAIAAATAQIGLLFQALSLVHRLDGVPFLVLQIGLLAAAAASNRMLPPPTAEPRAQGSRWDAMSIALLLVIAILIAASGAQQALTPISGSDEAMYHGPRVAYWLQERTLFIPRTHNDRQTVFPFGAEMIAAWPLLFAKAEWTARMTFWASFPLAAAGIFILARTIGASRRAALAATLLFVSTPTVLDHAASLKSDAWLPVYVLGAAYAALRPRLPGERPGVRFVLAGALLAMAVNVKATALALGPGLAIAALVEWRPPRILRCLNGLALGTIAGAALSGLAVLLATNLARHGHPLGPSGLGKIVRADPGPRQFAAHAARAMLFLIDIPEFPTEGLRASFERAQESLADALGANVTLRDEQRGRWPGPFAIRVTPVSRRYSLGGLLWLPVLGAALIGAGIQAWRSRARDVLAPAATLALIQLPLLLGVVFLVRWMNGGPYRFWLGAYALSLPLTAKLLADLAHRWRPAAALLTCGLVAAAYPSLRGRISIVDAVINSSLPAAATDYPYEEVTPQLHSGARILLFASDNTREYGLFNARAGFTNQVYPWGYAPLTPAAGDALLASRRITHILIADDRAIASQWVGGIRTEPVVSWARSRADFREVPLVTPHMRLFERTPEP